MKVTAFILFVCCMVSCTNINVAPAGILKFDKMQSVFWDVIRAEALTVQLKKKDSLINTSIENLKLQQQIFAEHQTSKEEFYKSYKYYSKNVQLMRSLLDTITTLAERNKYKNLYSKPPSPERISLMPLPAPSLPVIIPMPIPTLNPVQSVVPDSTTNRNRIAKPLFLNQQLQ